MLRLIFLLVLAAAAPLPNAPPFHPSPAFTPAGPETAKGAVVWLHGGYDSDTEQRPPEPVWVGRLATGRWDIFRFDRTPGQDPLLPGGQALVQGLIALRTAGYRHVIVAGHSRGAFIAMAALAHPELAEAVALISPAAHGTSPDRRAQAMADFQARLDDAKGPQRLAFVQLDDDPFDPDPEARAQAVRAAAARTGDALLLIARPPQPRGHMGGYDPVFDTMFGEKLAEFVAGDR